MKARKLFLALFGVLGLGGGLVVSNSAQATVAEQCNPRDEVCACKAALKENTIAALEEFLRKYPPGRKATACSALALNALNGFGPGNPGESYGGGPEVTPGYGG